MKLRVTLMTENDKHLPCISKEELERMAKEGWETTLKYLLQFSTDKSENACVESCELVEE